MRAVASGRRRGSTPRWRRVELRYVDLKGGRRLQVTAYDGTQAHTANHAPGDEAREAVDALLDEPFGNWHVDTTTQSHQVRVTKKGEALLHTAEREEVEAEADGDHDRDKGRLLPEDDPVFVALGLSDHEGRMKPSRQAKYRQVEEFLRILDASVTEAVGKGHLRRPTDDEPLRIADLGCGNGYLTFAAQRFLTHVRGLPVVVTGVDVRQQSADHNTAVATGLGMAADFVVGGIAEVTLDPPPESCWRCTRATPRPTTRWPAPSSGRRRWCWPLPAATTTSPRSCAATPRPRRTPCSPVTASCASGSPTP